MIAIVLILIVALIIFMNIKYTYRRIKKQESNAFKMPPSTQESGAFKMPPSTQKSSTFISDPAARVGAYPTQRPGALVDSGPRMQTERNGVSITNGKANRVLWGLDSGIKAGAQKYPKFPTATGNLEYSDDYTLENNAMYANDRQPDASVLHDYPNTPDEFITMSSEINPRISGYRAATTASDGEEDYKKYVSGVINVDDTDGRITQSNLNRGFKIIQARALSAQSKVEKYRPFYEQQLRERTCWLNADDPIM
jgi:hypothetical protein